MKLDITFNIQSSGIKFGEVMNYMSVLLLYMTGNLSNLEFVKLFVKLII